MRSRDFGFRFPYRKAKKCCPPGVVCHSQSGRELKVFHVQQQRPVVAQINKFQGASFFWFFAALMAGVTGIFIWTASRYKVREYIEDGSAPVGH